MADGNLIADVDRDYQASYSLLGSLRLYSPVVNVAGNNQVVLCKVNPVNGEVTMLDTYLLDTTSWNTLRARNPTLALAPISTPGN